MDKNDSSNTRSDPDRTSRSLDYLRRRSQHRLWWSSARIALQRGRLGEPLNQPNGQSATGKRV